LHKDVRKKKQKKTGGVFSVAAFGVFEDEWMKCQGVMSDGF